MLVGRKHERQRIRPSTFDGQADLVGGHLSASAEPMLVRVPGLSYLQVSTAESGWVLGAQVGSSARCPPFRVPQKPSSNRSCTTLALTNVPGYPRTGLRRRRLPADLFFILPRPHRFAHSTTVQDYLPESSSCALFHRHFSYSSYFPLGTSSIRAFVQVSNDPPTFLWIPFQQPSCTTNHQRRLRVDYTPT